MVVDAEKPIPRMLKSLLERQGYHVTTQSNSQEALSLFKVQPENFDLLITDQAMPELTGEHLAKEVLNIRADMPIILCTGFSSTIDKEKAMTIGIKAFAMKPVGQNIFSKLVRHVLDGKSIPM